MREWREVLAGCSAEQLGYALDNWQGEFPPNCYQFRTLAKQMPRMRLNLKALARKTGEELRQAGEKQVAKMRGILRKGGADS